MLPKQGAGDHESGGDHGERKKEEDAGEAEGDDDEAENKTGEEDVAEPGKLGAWGRRGGRKGREGRGRYEVNGGQGGEEGGKEGHDPTGAAEDIIRVVVPVAIRGSAEPAPAWEEEGQKRA